VYRHAGSQLKKEGDISMQLKVIHLVAVAALCMAAPGVLADSLPPTPPPYHSDSPTRLEQVLNQADMPVSAYRTGFGSFPGKEVDIVDNDNRDYNVDDPRLYVNGIVVKTGEDNTAQLAGLEFEVSETISNRVVSNTDVSARYVDAADIPSLQKFLATMAQVAESTPQSGANSEVTFQTPGGTTFYYQQNGSHSPDFAIVNGSGSYYTFFFQKLGDVEKFKNDVDQAAAWVTQH
jgi:hypothetical protein